MMTTVAGRLSSAAAAQAVDDLALKRAQSNSTSREQQKIQKAGKDFESILLGSWLQGAERSFAAAPGGDDEEGDGGKDQFMGMAMQQLAGALVNTGGIGIARMITGRLEEAATHKAAEGEP